MRPQQSEKTFAARVAYQHSECKSGQSRANQHYHVYFIFHLGLRSWMNPEMLRLYSSKTPSVIGSIASTFTLVVIVTEPSAR
jgi:hypothetical protein